LANNYSSKLQIDKSEKESMHYSLYLFSTPLNS